MGIGRAIRRLRHSQNRTLQHVCDTSQGKLQTGYLSRIERDEMTPSVYVAAAIARALGTSVDSLIAEAEGGIETAGLPSASRLMVPVFRWEDAITFYQDRDYTNLPTPERWLVPPMESHLGMFGLPLRDDSMQALDGLSWSRGSTIIVDISREPTQDDYVLASDGSNPTPLFRQLVSDGRDFYLRPRNPQYPMRPVTGNSILLGTVIGQVTDISDRELG